jgi:hypothetical protein
VDGVFDKNREKDNGRKRGGIIALLWWPLLHSAQCEERERERRK